MVRKKKNPQGPSGSRAPAGAVTPQPGDPTDPKARADAIANTGQVPPQLDGPVSADEHNMANWAKHSSSPGVGETDVPANTEAPAPAVPYVESTEWTLHVAGKDGFGSALFLANDSKLIHPSGRPASGEDVGWQYDLGSAKDLYHTPSYSIPLRKPDVVLMNNEAPGDTMYETNLGNVPKAVGLLLAQEVREGTDLYDLRTFFWNAGFTHSVITTAIPRSGQRIVPGQSHSISSRLLVDSITSVVKAMPEGEAPSTSFITIYTMVIKKALSQVLLITDTEPLGLIIPETEIIVNDDILEQHAIIHHCEEIFSDAAFKRLMTVLPKELTPSTLAAELTRFLRDLVEPLASLKEQLVQIRTATRLARQFVFDPSGMQEELKNFSPLMYLSRIVNFYVGELGDDRGQNYYMTDHMSERKRAIESTLGMIRKIPSLSLISTDDFAKMYGFVGADHLGLFRGAVLWSHQNRPISFSLAWKFEESNTTFVQPVSQALFPSAQVSKLYSEMFSDLEAWRSVANLIADELTYAVAADSERQHSPQLRAFLVTPVEASILACIKANSLYADFSSETGRPILMFGMNAHDRWIGRLPASNGTQYVFSDMRAALLYWCAGALRGEERIPLSHNTSKLVVSAERINGRGIQGMDPGYFDNGVIHTYAAIVHLPTEQTALDGSVHSEVEVHFPVLQPLSGTLGRKGQTAITTYRTSSSYGHIRDFVGTWRTSALFWMVACLTSSPYRTVSDKAGSWLYYRVGALAERGMASVKQYVGEELLRYGLHTAEYVADMPRVYAEASIHYAIAPLVRFGHMTYPASQRIVSALPINYLLPSAARSITDLWRATHNGVPYQL